MDRIQIIAASFFATSMVIFTIIYLVQGIALNGSWLMATVSGIAFLITMTHSSNDYQVFVEEEES